MSKTTLTTIKTFIKKAPVLFIKCKSQFDGMTDGVETVDDEFSVVTVPEHNHPNTMGIDGAWFVFGSRDYFREYSDETFEGYEVSNSCGSFILAKEKVNG